MKSRRIAAALLVAPLALAQAPMGKTLFQSNCGFCHGPDARGASGPDLIRSALLSHDKNGDQIAPVIRNGRPGKGMPAFAFSDEQIRAVADFLHAEVKSAATVARTVPTEYPLEKLLVGNAQAGKRYFETDGGCIRCHSVAGDLAHIATKYKPFDLQSRIAFPYGAKPTVSIADASGTFTGEEVYADEFLISIRDSHGWIRTFRRDGARIEVHDPLAAHVELLRRYTEANLHDLFAYLETLR